MPAHFIIAAAQDHQDSFKKIYANKMPDDTIWNLFRNADQRTETRDRMSE